MARELEIAKRYLITVARPIATQLVEFGDKLAVGTGAALVLIISQLGTLSDYIPVPGILIAAIFAIGSLLAYMIARYSSIQATVIADAQQKFDEIGESMRELDAFDFDEYKRRIIETSVWPATWTIAWGIRRLKGTEVINSFKYLRALFGAARHLTSTREAYQQLGSS